MTRKLRAAALVGLSATMLLLAASLAGAAPGDLDPSFGTGGLSSPPAPTNYGYSGQALAVQPDGKILTAGYEQFMSGQTDMAVQRFSADGSLDMTFGGGDGVATIDVPTANSSSAFSVKVLSSGSIIVGGERVVSGNNFEFVVATIDETGVLDSSFDGDAGNTCGPSAGNGIVCIRVSAGAGTDRGKQLAIEPDGDILLAGSAYLSPGIGMAGVIRLKPTGALDSTFGGDGRVTVPLADNSWDSWGNTVNLQTDGSILVSGGIEGKGDNGLGVEVYVYALGFVRLDSSGVPDPTFHSVQAGYTGPPYTYGVILSPRGAAWSYGAVSDTALQPDGKLVATGYANNGSPVVLGSSVVALRLTTSGALDPTYGSGGRTLLDFGKNNSGERIRLDSTGRAYIAGYYAPDAINYEYATRLTPAGTLDTAFGASGLKQISWGPDVYAQATGVDFQPDGKLIVLGGGFPGGRVGLARLITASDPITPPAPLPTVAITSPKSKSLKAKNFRVMSGTAGPTGSVKSVDVALQRIDKKALKKKRCYFLKSKKASFKSVKATKGKCSKPYYRAASGTTSWKYRLTRTLPKGSYVLTVRVTLLDGRTGQVTKKFKLK